MQQLPAKDQQVFRSIVKFYETKQYKKGVKAADSILKKHPDHGETLCMKGLTLSYLDKKEEAYDLVRKGLKHDIKSHVCWHVFGLLYRQDRNYKQAVNCYAQALKIDPENIQILRDLSLLQIHRRELGGFAETRRKLLQVKPSNRLNWVGYAIAEHLCKNFEFAWTCLDNYEKTFKDESVTEYENSELYLYKASIMEESGNLESALECLVAHESQICDKLGLLEIKSRLLMFLGRYAEAAEIYRKLIKTNCEQHFYILGLMANTPEFHGFWPPLSAPRPVTAEGEEEPTTDEAALSPNISSFPQHVHPDGMPITGWLPPAHSLAKNNQRRVAIGKRQHKRRIDTYSPSRPLTDEEEQKVTEFIDELLKEYPKSDSVARVLLYFVTGDRFLARLDAFLRPRLRKGIPSLFRMIRPLYFQEGKAALIEKLLLQYTTYLPEDLSWFGPKWGEKDGVKPDRAEEEPPSSLLFARMVLSEHYDYLGETEKALKVCNEAIEHTPTLVEIYACKARIYKHAGDLQESAKWFDEVRQMDLADRFLNTQAVRALLRVDNIKEGVEKVLMFSKEPDAPEAANLHDMQCMWYESAVGRSYYRQHNYGKALKEFHETFKHFSDIAEDQFDFHNYCLRKTTLKTYVAMLRMQERLYSHKFYRRAAKDAVRIYLELYDKKQSGDDSKDDEENGKDDEAEMSAADKKKLKHKMKREKKKEEEVAPQTDSKTGKPKKVDEDPDGKKLLEKDPMEEASTIVSTLVRYCSLDPITHVMTYDVFSRRGKLLHCLQALVQLHKLAGGDITAYKLVGPLAHFCFVAELEGEAVNATVREVVLAELATLFLGKDAAPFASVAAMRVEASKAMDKTEQRLKDTSDLPFIEVLYGLKAMKHAGRDCRKFLESWKPTGALSLKDSNKMLKYLSAEFGADSKIYQACKAHCLLVFPLMVA